MQRQGTTWKYFRIGQSFGAEWIAATVHRFDPKREGNAEYALLLHY